jgi:hypothetical protein
MWYTLIPTLLSFPVSFELKQLWFHRIEKSRKYLALYVWNFFGGILGTCFWNGFLFISSYCLHTRYHFSIMTMGEKAMYVLPDIF